MDSGAVKNALDLDTTVVTDSFQELELGSAAPSKLPATSTTTVEHIVEISGDHVQVQFSVLESEEAEVQCIPSNETESDSTNNESASIIVNDPSKLVVIKRNSASSDPGEHPQVCTDFQDSLLSNGETVESVVIDCNNGASSIVNGQSDMQIPKSSGERDVFSYDGELFNRDKKYGNTVYYRCIHAAKGCRARVMSKPNQNGRALIANTEPHSSHSWGGQPPVVPVGDIPSESMDIEEVEVSENDHLSNGHAQVPLENSLDVLNSASDPNLSQRQQRRLNAKKADKNLLEPLKFMHDFDPQKRSEQKKRKRYTDGRVHLVASDFEECDCLAKGCPGCHYPCKSCGDTKCGHECRQGRRWVYESIEIEGRAKELKNYRFTNHTTKSAN